MHNLGAYLLRIKTNYFRENFRKCLQSTDEKMVRIHVDFPIVDFRRVTISSPSGTKRYQWSTLKENQDLSSFRKSPSFQCLADTNNFYDSIVV
jgi:hypothetical protein